jgi:DNA-binding transcriptional ArsR family regulator
MVKYNATTLNATFAALADPTRRRILESLSHQHMRVTDLAEPFAMSLPAVSKHLRVLENAGLLKRSRMGREHHIELEPKPMKDALVWIEQYRKFWEGSLDALAAYLEEEQKPKPKKTKKGKKS